MITLAELQNKEPKHYLCFLHFAYRVAEHVCKVYGTGNLNPAMMVISNKSEGDYGIGDLAGNVNLDALIHRSGVGRKSFKEMAEDLPNLIPAASIIPCAHKGYRVCQLNAPTETWIHYGSLMLPERSIIVEDNTSWFSKTYYVAGRILMKYFWFESHYKYVGLPNTCPTYLDELLCQKTGMKLQTFITLPNYRRQKWSLGIINLNYPGIFINYLY